MEFTTPYEQKELIGDTPKDIFASQPWGSHQKRIVRQIAENGHPVITVDMFKQFAKARIEAAQALAPEENKENLKKLLDIFESFFDDKYVADFTQAKIAQYNTYQQAELSLQAKEINYTTFLRHKADAQKYYNEAFNKLYRHNVKQLKKINLLLAHYIDPAADPKKIIKKINQKAYELRATQARPIQENHYQLGEIQVTHSHIPEGWLTHEQHTLYERTNGIQLPTDQPYSIPSPIRDERQIGQVNAVRAEIDINGKKVFTGHRHGSPCVYKIHDEIQRQYRTLENVKQTLTLAAREQLLSLQKEFDDLENILPDKRTPVEKKRRQYLNEVLTGKRPLAIDLSSMSLLSPIVKEETFTRKLPLDPLWQYRQVNDSRFAYWSLHGRKIMLSDFIDSQGNPFPLEVELNSTFMSIGVNAMRGIGTSQAKALVQRINNRGLNQFIDNFLSRSFLTPDPQINAAIASIRELENQAKTTEIKHKIAHFNKEKLHHAYQTLESINKKIVTNNNSGKELRKLKSLRKKALSVINTQEKKLDKQHRKLIEARTKSYQSRIKEVNAKLDAIQKQLESQNKLKNHPLFKQLRLFVDMLDVYYTQPKPGLMRFIKVFFETRNKNKLIRKLNKTSNLNKRGELAKQVAEIQARIDLLNKGNYRFQARFAVLAQEIGHFVEWFCKSGEDRSGLLEEHITALCIFMEKYGYPPRWDNEQDAVKFYQLMSQVHNGSPNRETNGFNDDAPGLKVTDKDFVMPTLSYATDKLMANLTNNSMKLGKNATLLLQKAQTKFEKLTSSMQKLSSNLSKESLDAQQASKILTEEFASKVMALHSNPNEKSLPGFKNFDMTQTEEETQIATVNDKPKERQAPSK